MVIVSSTPYPPLLLCSNLLLMCMHQTLVTIVCTVHFSVPSGAVDLTEIKPCKEVGISEGMYCYWTDACYMNKSPTMIKTKQKITNTKQKQQ